MATCKFGCDGDGRIPNDDGGYRICACSFAAKMRAHLGPEVAGAIKIPKSPLFKCGQSLEPGNTVRDLTQNNMFLRGYWQVVLPHLKFALIGRGLTFTFRIVTDQRLLSVWLGKESYGNRTKEEREGGESDPDRVESSHNSREREIHNGVGDLIGKDVDLVIIRLGFLGYKNQAMPGVLKEALLLREGLCKPTWLVEVPSSPFCPGNYCYSTDVATYIQEHYKIHLLGDKNKQEDPAKVAYQGGTWAVPQADENGDVTLGPGEPRVVSPKVVPVSTFEGADQREIEGAGALGGSGDKKRGKSKPKSPGYGKKGGGPLG